MNTAAVTRRHVWLPGPPGSALELVVDGAALPPRLASLSAHRRRRGPYTLGGSLVRHIAHHALATWPELLREHDIEVLAVAPELAAALEPSRETLTSAAVPDERTRFYPSARTLGIAHGLTELLVEHVRRTGEAPLSLVVEDAGDTDPTDAELLSVLLRRVDPGLLTIVVCGKGLPDGLTRALEAYAARAEVATGVPGSSPAPAEAGDLGLAQRYVGTECTSTDDVLRAAYDRLSPGDRARLHDERADELESTREASLLLGAIPFHRECGSAPRVAGAEALTAAIEHCVMYGFYDAVLELGPRARALLDWDAEPERCWLVLAKECIALGALDRAEEAEVLYDEACARTTLPSVHLQAAYGRAMLLTRFHRPERRDRHKARAWVNTAIAIASLSPESDRRAYNLTFQENGLALIEMHEGNLEEALRLVTEGLARMDAELQPERHVLHRSVLRSNRAQLLVRLGHLDDALAEYAELVRVDPNHFEYRFDRAGLLRQLGRDQEAFAEYGAVVDTGLAYPEPHYNRADLALEWGDLETALAELTRVIELDPAFVDAYVNRASVLHQLGDLAGARRDVDEGLSLDPAQPHLHTILGLIAQEEGRTPEARHALETAISLDPSLAAAWSNLAVMDFEDGDLETAIERLSRSLELDDDPQVRANRALALRQAGRWGDAVADYTAALDADVEDAAELHYGRALCHVELGERVAADADLRAAAGLGHPVPPAAMQPEPEEARRLAV